MDDVIHRLAHELAEVIGAGVSEDPKVEACREKARAAGYEMRISLEAVIGFGSRDGSQALAKMVAPKEAAKPIQRAGITANDRRFLRSLRIAADEMNQEVE
jgi:hypothetical protein